MPVPTSIADLDSTAANNSPAGSDSIGTSLDDYLRAHAAIIKQNSFAAGTRLAFAQAAAPTGWVQDTTDNADNRMLRVVKTAGNGVAGSSSPILMDVVPSHTHTFTTSSNGSHTHTATDAGHTHGQVTAISYGGAVTCRYDDISATSSGSTLIQGVSTLTGFASISVSTDGSHDHTGTVAANGSAANWTPRYIDLIICAKS